ncbi:MAG: hypothetical protein R2824_24160 [Saprospiraceae bacterium]
MRRKDRHILTGVAIGATVTSLADIILQWLEHRNANQAFTWESYDGFRTLEKSIIGGAIGAGIGYATYQFKISEEAKFPFDSDKFLKKLLTQESLRADPKTFEIVNSVRAIVKKRFWEAFKSDLVIFPEDVGSFFKKTALLSSFDLDIILAFKKGSYQSLEKMYYDVYEVAGAEFGQEAIISKESKAIGLSIDYNGHLIHFDIVPGREINNYKTDRDLNLYVRPEWFWQKGTQFKTNTQFQKKITANNPKARAVIMLLKKYRNANRIKLPSSIIEQYTVAALSDTRHRLNFSETENLLNTMDYIARKITQCSLIDLANSNNNLHEKIAQSEREYIAYLLNRDINRIEKNSRYIKEIFE